MWDELWIDEQFNRRYTDLIEKSGKFRINRDGKTEVGVLSQQTNTPWVVIKPSGNCNFIIWFGVYFKYFCFYPEFCKHRCYKVVVYPKTCKELFDFYSMMVGWGFPSKIGVEVRDYIPNKPTNYAAFFWCNGEQEGKERFEFIKNKVGDSMKCILKRSCTEMELAEKAGTITVNPEWEKRLDNSIKFPTIKQVVPDWVINKTKIYWLKYARQTGDTSYRDIATLPADSCQYNIVS